ncbi:winged helix-turn-helix domain-containing protein [Novosphingobium sp. 9U]|uniref:winged helix-turn-helix domain-containing protein n=1 Tax=Novosphingobium sp. 9U TaxID=2653158 RepID=UPI0012EFED0E|nr:winged helix-turn-helix domain-containing protein [Novosphingobium sp. 9U]VWX53424.1 hypothetical protein NOVOSPHI9U_50072 [Novosphingobium sp. 9U]
MGAFRWISEGSIPANCDLRHHGWRLAEADETASDCILIAHAAECEGRAAPSPQQAWDHARRLTLVSGVNTGATRARLLAAGFGEAVSDQVPLAEVHARARRLHDLAGWLPRQRTIRELKLDLISREATYRGRTLGLHPAEFTMLWRMSETLGQPVSKDTLAKDLWGAGSISKSNSMAVQLSRLRAKLACAGLANLIITIEGGYRLDTSMMDLNPRPTWMALGQICP